MERKKASVIAENPELQRGAAQFRKQVAKQILPDHKFPGGQHKRLMPVNIQVGWTGEYFWATADCLGANECKTVHTQGDIYDTYFLNTGRGWIMREMSDL